MKGIRIFLQPLIFLLIEVASHTRNADAQTTSSNITFTVQEENNSTAPLCDDQGCLIDPRWLLIVLACAGGLLLSLLVSTVTLACQVCHLQHQAGAPRPARSNMDLVSGTGYWGTDHSEGGIVGPCDASVMLEEVRADGKEDDKEEDDKEEEERGEDTENGEEWKAAEEQETDDSGTTGEMAKQMQSPRDSFLEVPQDLENMPLVV